MLHDPVSDSMQVPFAEPVENARGYRETAALSNAGGSWHSRDTDMDPFGAEALAIKPPPEVTNGASESDGAALDILQEWEGVVLSVAEETFSARLRATSANRLEEEADFLLAEVDHEDIDLVEPGAVFYWTLGRLSRPRRSTLTVTAMRFRRLPRWTSFELKAIDSEAKRALDELGW